MYKDFGNSNYRVTSVENGTVIRLMHRCIGNDFYTYTGAEKNSTAIRPQMM